MIGIASTSSISYPKGHDTQILLRQIKSDSMRHQAMTALADRCKQYPQRSKSHRCAHNVISCHNARLQENGICTSFCTLHAPCSRSFVNGEYRFLPIEDTPMLEIGKFVGEFIYKQCVAVLEDVHSVFGSSAQGTFNFGLSKGFLLGLLIPYSAISKASTLPSWGLVQRALLRKSTSGNRRRAALYEVCLVSTVFFLFAIPAIIGCCVAAFLKWLDKK